MKQSSNSKKPLVVIVGPTASGKSALAMDIARIHSGEIICADSRTVYKGMDIGTAKPSIGEQNEIPHHLLDVINPSQVFTAAEFKRRAMIWVDDITIRGRLPIMVGGTGLYVDGVIFDFAFLPPVAPEERAELEAKSIDELQALIGERGIAMPKNLKNKRHLVRALETNGEVPVRKGLRGDTLVIGLDIEKSKLERRIGERVEVMISQGFVEEIKDLADKYGWDAPGLQAPGYKAFRKYLDGAISIEEAKRQFVHNDMQLAKRQRTWFKRNPHIVWVQNADQALEEVQKFLQKSK